MYLEMLNAESKENVDRRLARIVGQVEGLRRMVNDDRYCIDIVVQVSAARAALARVAALVLEQHLETCLADAFATGDRALRDEKITELMDVFKRHGNA